MKIIDYPIKWSKNLGDYIDFGNKDYIRCVSAICRPNHNDYVFAGFVFEDDVVRHDYWSYYYVHDDSGVDYVCYEYAKKARYRINED